MQSTAELEESTKTVEQPNSVLEKLFQLKAHGTTKTTEIIAGITTFMTMVYIIFVNPQILGAAGMDTQAVFVVTCLIAAIGSIAMGLMANLPISLAPAMGLNAFFAFSLVIGMGISWQLGMGAIFWGAVGFFLMSVFGLRSWILSNIPQSLRMGIPAGIGLLIALLGLQNAGIIVDSPATLVTVGDLTSIPCALGFLSFLIIVALSSMRIHASALISILVVTLLAAALGEVEFTGFVAMPPSIDGVFGQLDIIGALDFSLAGVIFALALISMFDSSGTLMAVTEKIGVADERGRFPRMKQSLLTDSSISVLGAVFGTSTVVSYIESSAGVAVGGRTGLAAVVTGLLFLAVIFFSPLAAMVPAYAISGALIYVGVLMTSSLARVAWEDMTEAAPAFMAAVLMPFTFSITEGVAAGFITYAVLKLSTGRWKEIHPGVALVAALFLIKFIFVDGH